MSERRKQNEFLKVLMNCGSSADLEEWERRIKKAEGDERCIRCAVFLVGLLGLLALCGVGYSAVLLPDFFDGSTPVVLKFFCALGLGCLICLITFVAVLLWYRAMTNRVYDECRGFVLRIMNVRPNDTAPTQTAQNSVVALYQNRTPEPVPTPVPVTATNAPSPEAVSA